jgi:Fe-S oxidoreductase
MVPDTTRELFRLLEPWQKYVFYALAVVTVVVFVVCSIRKLLRYDFFKLMREKGFWKKLFRGVWDASTNRTVLHGDIFAGTMHFFIFWGMVLLFIGTLIIVLDADIIAMINPAWEFWKDTFSKIYSFIMDFFGLIAFIGIIGMMCRRLYLRRTQMSYDTKTLNDHGTARNSILDDWAFVSLLLFVIVGGFFIEGLRLIDPKYYGTEWYSFAGTFMANILIGLGMTVATANAIFPQFWWLHGIISFIWIIYIPFSKGWHIFASILSLTVRDDMAGKRLSKSNLEDEKNFPTGTVKDLTNRSFIQIDACMRCGRCHMACPARACDQPLSPRDLIMNMKPLSPSRKEDKIVGPVIKEEMIWACTTCYACMNRCPVKVEHIPFFIEMRRYLVMIESKMAPEVQNVLQSLERAQNAYSMPNESRGEWATELGVKVLDESGETDVLFFVGCAASFDPRNQEVAKAFIKALQRANVDVAILGPREGCCGDPARRLGHEFLAQILMQNNVTTLNAMKFKRIVTMCPHCYNTIKNEYPQFGGNYKVVHHMELIDELMKEGKLKVNASVKEKVTYHDSCYLGRYNDIYEPQRDILRKLGCELIEMERNRETSFCCGAGGGKAFMEDHNEKRINHARTDEAIGTKARYLATACPFCMTMFEDATKFKEVHETLTPTDIVELVERGTR